MLNNFVPLGGLVLPESNHWNIMVTNVLSLSAIYISVQTQSTVSLHCALLKLVLIHGIILETKYWSNCIKIIRKNESMV